MRPTDHPAGHEERAGNLPGIVVSAASRHILLALPPDPGSARLARRAVMRLPSLRERRRLCFDVQLAVSELVSSGVVNAHADDTLRLAVHADDRRLRIEVRSHGAAFQPYDPLGEPRTTPGTLRGLQLVAAVSDRWGVEWQDGSLVWAEFDLPTD
jgi:anti-sigma regulatory factor (Ser/Thr protein kinase)